MQSDYNAPPINPLPWVVWALALPTIAIEVVVQLHAIGFGGSGGQNWRFDAVQLFAFSPDWLRGWLATGRFPEEAYRTLSYMVVNPSFTSSLFAVVMILALGKMVAEVFRWWAVAVVYLGAGVAGSVGYTLLLPGNSYALIGGFPGVYGLIGAYTFLIWVRQVATGGSQLRAFSLIGALLVIQLVFGLLFGDSYYWVAELSGFAAGFMLSFAVAPGGWRRVIARLRRR